MTLDQLRGDTLTLSGGLEGSRLTISIEGVIELDRALSRWSHDIKDPRPFFEDAEKILKLGVAEQFLSQGDRGSTGGWAPLSPRYAAWKQQKFGPKPILEASGKLKASFTRLTMSTSELVWGSRLAYAKYHQRGTTRMKKRKILEFTQQDKRAFMKALQRMLMFKGSKGVETV